MDEYLMKYGFSPLNTGVDRYFKSESDYKPEKSGQKIHHEKQTPSGEYTEKFSDTKLKDLPLTMVYVPMQKYKDCYTYEEALKAGTLFPELDKPFLGKKEWLK